MNFVQSLTLFFAMSVCFFNSLPYAKYSDLLNLAAFSNDPLSGKISSPAKNLHFSTFHDDEPEILADCPSKLY